MRRVDLVIFDLDGTLIDSAPGIVACLAAAFEAVAPGCDLPALRPFIGPPVARMIPAIAPWLSAAGHAAVLAEFRERYDAAGCDEVRVLPGATDTLDELRRRSLACALATYKPQGPTLRILTRTGLGTRFGAVRTIDGRGGPFEHKSEMLADLVKWAGIPSSRALYVGDTPADEIAAGQAGTRFFGVGNGAPGATSLMDVLGQV